MDLPPTYSSLFDTDSKVPISEKPPRIPDDGGEPSTRYSDDLRVADGIAPAAGFRAEETGESSTQFPPIPPAPEEPSMVDYTQIQDPVVRKVAEKEGERAWKRYEKAVKDRTKLVRDREKALGKIDRRKGKEIEYGAKERRKERKETGKEGKERMKEAKEVEKEKGREEKERAKELKDLEKEERRRLKTLKEVDRENQRSQRDKEREQRDKTKELKDWETEKNQLFVDEHIEKIRDRGKGKKDCKEWQAWKNASPQEKREMESQWKEQAHPECENGQSSGIIESSRPASSSSVLFRSNTQQPVPPTTSSYTPHQGVRQAHTT